MHGAGITHPRMLPNFQKKKKTEIDLSFLVVYGCTRSTDDFLTRVT